MLLYLFKIDDANWPIDVADFEQTVAHKPDVVAFDKDVVTQMATIP